jgi:L,D-transpeptidase ErfK/SrfK
MRALVIVTLLTVPLAAIEPAQSTISTEIAGEEITYHAQAGDTLTSIGARFGVEPAVLARRNGLRAGQLLAVGQTLTVDHRHIVPSHSGESLLINVPQRMLFQFRDGRAEGSYPVGLGRP